MVVDLSVHLIIKITYFCLKFWDKVFLFVDSFFESLSPPVPFFDPYFEILVSMLSIFV